MSPRLKTILAIVVGAVALAFQLAANPESIESVDTGPAFVRLAIVFGVPALAASLAVAWLRARRKSDVASTMADTFLGVIVVLGGVLIVADIVSIAA